jgi:hypothetical protein
MKEGTIVMNDSKSKKDMEVTAGKERQRMVQDVVERVEDFLTGKITRNQVIDQINGQFGNELKLGALEDDFSVELNKYKLGDQFVREAKKFIVLNLTAYLEGRNTIEEVSEVLEVVLATQKERTNDDNDFEIDENGDILEVSEIEKHEENANYRLSRYSRPHSDDSKIKELANKRFKSEDQRQACLRSVEGKATLQYLYTPLDVITRKNFIAPGKYGEASKTTKTYLFMIRESVECEDGFLKGLDGTNRYPTRMTLMCMNDWSIPDEDNFNEFNEFEVVSLTEPSLDYRFKPGDPRFNYYVCFNGLVLEVRYKKGLRLILTNSVGRYSEKSPTKRAKRYIMPTSTGNKSYLVHRLVNAAFPIYNFFSEKRGFEVSPNDVFHVHHINCCSWENQATNLIELPLPAHRYIHNKGSFDILKSDPRYSSFHLNLIKLLKEMCAGRETRPLSYFIDNGLI